MLGIIKKMFMGLLISIVNTSNHTKCVSVSKQEDMNEPTLEFTSQWMQSRVSLLSICG